MLTSDKHQQHMFAQYEYFVYPTFEVILHCLVPAIGRFRNIIIIILVYHSFINDVHFYLLKLIYCKNGKSETNIQYSCLPPRRSQKIHDEMISFTLSFRHNIL